MKVSKKLVLGYHKDACIEFKKRIEKDFPKLFEKKELEVGKWYKHDYSFLFCFNGKYGNSTNYGFNYKGIWSNKLGVHRYEKYTPATEKEVETALINEAKKRELWNCPILDIYNETRTDYSCLETYSMILNELWSRYGKVFKNGKWATIIETITKEEAEKQLGKKIV